MNTRNPLTVFDRFMNEMGSDLTRTLVGFDSVFDGMRNTLGAFDNYPPYNVEKINDTKYRVSIALAGFGEKDIQITKEGNFLIIIGKIEKDGKADNPTYLYHGIANRAFIRKVQLAHDIEVISADMENGLLHINLEKVIPEEKKPRIIEIGGSKSTKKSKS